MRLDSSETRSDSRSIPVTAFVDWNAQIHNAGVSSKNPPDKRAGRTMTWMSKIIGKLLIRQAPAARFNVGLRLYHGWYKGWERSENYRAITGIVRDNDLSALSSTPNVAFSSEVQYGHTLLAAIPERRHDSPSIHLPNTWRRQTGDSTRREKMVDTALAADLLEWAREDQDGWAIVLSEDDDIVPPIFTAEAWTRPHGGRVFIARSRRGDAFLKLDGLLLEVKR